MAEYILSKSTFIRGLQCLKSLYLNKHRPYLRDKLSDEQLAKFARGHSIGKLARDLFPGGIDIPPPGKAAAIRTANEIANGASVLYEACFIHNEVIIAIDILVFNEGEWSAYEVKSSGSLSKTYFRDASLQNYVIKGTGLDLKRFFLVYRNLELPADNYHSINDLFIFQHLQETDILHSEIIERNLEQMKETLILSNSPAVIPGNHCMDPYPCDFRGVCWKKLGEGQINILMNSAPGKNKNGA
jgi:hypothetical protein